MSGAANGAQSDAMLTADEALAYTERGPSLAELCKRARERSPGPFVTYSPKVFIPLTHLCRDVCHYCTFARPPRRGERRYLSEDEVLAVAEAGRSAGCHEALFTLGDNPSCAPGSARGARSAGIRHDRRLPGALRRSRAT